MSKELVFKEMEHNGSREIRLSHRNLAEYMGLRQGDVRDLIEKHIAHFEQISQCPFQTEMVEIGSGAHRETKVFYLDSDQTNFLIGLTRPTETTLVLKLNVVLRFKEAKERLSQLGATAANLPAREAALSSYLFEIRNRCDAADLLGYSQGYKRKEALEIGIEMEQETGIRVCPNFLLNDKDAIAPDSSLDPKLGTHAALVATGTLSYTPSYIASLFPSKGITGTRINEFLCKTGLQTKKGPGRYIPTAKGKMLCQESTRTSGPHKGETFIVQWLWQDNKTLRDIVETAVTSFLSARAPVVKKRPWERI